MQLFNTLTKKKETLKPLNEPEVTLYTCGPTVYMEPHIGNWRNNIFYDTLVRALKLSGYKPKHVLNITDVGHLVSDQDEGEDKLQLSARKQKKSAWDIAEYYIELYLAGRKILATIQPHLMPRATDHIKEQVLLIEILEKKGYTYQTSDGVYFDTSKLKDYGKLVGKGMAGLQAGARVKVNKEKKNPHDFALWKLSPKDEKRDMEWESPWGMGFPGWHLECSAMALEYLGKTIDIHAGGVDHIGTHHTNEIAQSEAATEQEFTNIWVHNEFLQSEGKKMAKSSGNFFTLTDIIKKQFNPLAFRLLMLQAHYRSPINFTWKSLTAAQQNLQDLYMVADRQFQLESLMENPADEVFAKLVNDTKSAVIKALQDDLDTPMALSKIQPVIRYVLSHAISEVDKDVLLDFLKNANSAFGLRLVKREDLTTEQRELFEKRNQARKAGEFAEADQLRDALSAQNILLEDTESKTFWYRKA